MADFPGVSIVVVNYNGLVLLKACLDSVREQTYVDSEVIFVDNASSDGSVEFVKNNYPAAKVIINRKNLGYAPAANIGIKNAHGEFVAILNNDTKADPRWIENLVKAMQEDEKIGSSSPKQLKFYDPNIIDAAGALVHRGAYQTNRGHGEEDGGQYDKTAEVFGPSGAAAVYRKRMLEAVGMFDDDFISYQEEFDLSVRARLGGWRSVYVPEAVVYHIGGQTRAKADQKFLVYYMERNRLLTIIKDYPLGAICRYLPFMAKYEVDIMVRLFTRLETAPILARIAAMILLPKMLRKRMGIQRKRVISNREFRKWIVR